MPIIYHITTSAAWNIAQQNGFYEAPSLKDEGFIHCSQDHQVAGVLERYYKNQTDLVKLVIDSDKLTGKFIFEWSPSTADTFPHVYGVINTEAVIDVVKVA
ncbi:DUF952 domain-containing protein [Lacibacter sp. MH-610]|uniref:DUF952 domain-containing protein n=1 Tax=Lacibacter sp. MH-610 TaxID=3020883 RepID=UPI00389222B8